MSLDSESASPAGRGFDGRHAEASVNVGRESGEGLREVLEENTLSGADLDEVDRAREPFGVEREDTGQGGREGR